MSSDDLSNAPCQKFKTIWSRPSIVYGLCKMHEDIFDVFPHFRSPF